VKRRLRSTPTIGIVGVGYMGIATGLAFAHRGIRVYGYDRSARVRAAVARGVSPYREAGLAELLRAERRRGRFSVVESVEQLVALADLLFLCVPTPPRRDGAVDLRPLRLAAKEVGTAVRGVSGPRVVVVKSTVVPGTTEATVAPILRRSSGRGPRLLGVAVNPEFLSEGRMVRDALSPERIVIGTSDARTARWLRRVYARFPAPVVELTMNEAELVKHASNAFLALKVSYANELSRWTERMGGDVDAVTAAVGADPRIGPAFLNAGPGFGGSCFDKDLRAFVRRGEEVGAPARTARAALDVNDEQTKHAFELVRSAAAPLRGKAVAVLGLAFKVGTDDVRESRAFPIVQRLVADGARVRLHDPVARRNFEREWRRRHGGASGRVGFSSTVAGALRGADVAVLQAEWPEYIRWSSAWSRSMRRPVLVDLRRAIPAAVALRTGLEVVALGVGCPPAPTRAGNGRRARRRTA